MDYGLLTILIWVFTSFIVYEASALSCYQCDSKVDADCKENFDHEHVDDLTVSSIHCDVDAAEYCVKTTGVWGGVVGTTRFCSSRHMGNQCQFITYPDHDRVYRSCIYTCSSNHCNHSNHVYPLYTLLFTAVAVTLVLVWR